jgi:5-methylthioadenosine/S-adenosylhomocysteine deaminase
VGSISVGKQADLVFLRADQVNVIPLIDPVTTVVVCADTSNVDSVFVAGRAVKRHGELVGVDMGNVRILLERSRNHLLDSAGMLPSWIDA